MVNTIKLDKTIARLRKEIGDTGEIITLPDLMGKVMDLHVLLELRADMINQGCNPNLSESEIERMVENNAPQFYHILTNNNNFEHVKKEWEAVTHLSIADYNLTKIKLSHLLHETDYYIGLLEHGRRYKVLLAIENDIPLAYFSNAMYNKIIHCIRKIG